MIHKTKKFQQKQILARKEWSSRESLYIKKKILSYVCSCILTIAAFFMGWLMTTMTRPLKFWRIPVDGHCRSSPSALNAVLKGMLMLPER